ncbi:MAG: hypothetical protein NVSMB27_42200 [Ktedonobacteraceae bacterium]
MRVAVVALILAVGAILILALSDALAPSGIGNLFGGAGVLLLCIPISLALFSFLAHLQNEPHKLKEPEKQELRDPSLLQPKE